MYKLLIILLIIIFFIFFGLIKKNIKKEYLDNIFINPKEYKELNDDRLDREENTYEGVQPKDIYFDIFDVNCVQTLKRPWSCLLIKGNTVNNIPRSNCKEICPDKFKSESIEEFKNFESKPYPSDYYCYSTCKKKCIKNKYNPFEPYKNTCGQNAISQVPLDIYLNEKECMKNSFPCEKLSKEKCLGNPDCGWCTNGIGKGQCFKSTPDGPLNLKLPCEPSRQNPTNSFKPGRLNPFEGVGQFF